MSIPSLFRSGAIGICALVLSWLIVGFGVTEAFRARGGQALTERLVPAQSAHLLEEAHLRIYSPLRDPAFLSAAALTATIPFFLAAAVTARLHTAPSTRGLLVTCLLIAVAVQLFLSREVFDPGYPTSIRLAGALQVLFAGSCAVIGVLVGTNPTRASTHERTA